VGIVQGVAAAVGAIGGAIGAGLGLGGIGGALFRMGVGMVVSSLLAPKPPRGALARRNSTFTIRQPSPSRRIPYGVTRLGGVFMYAETTGDGEYLRMVFGIGDGPIEAIDAIYFNEKEVPLTTTSNDANGRPIYFASAGSDWNKETTIAGAVPYAWFSKYTGAAGQPADATLVAASASKWTSSHTLDGIAYVAVTLLWNAEIFPQGVPNVSFKVRGRNDIVDSRTSTTAYSSNPALCLAHYLSAAKTGPNVDTATEIDDAALQTAANVCDETVALDAGGTESRYTCNGFVDLAENPEAIINDFKTCMAGWMVYAGGVFKMYAGAYASPTFTIDDDMIAGPVKVENKVPKRARFNTVKGVYQSPETLFQPTDFPSVTNSTYVTEDGEEIAQDIELVFTTSPATAQRIGKIALEKSRRQLSVAIVCNLRALPAEAGMTVGLTLERFGWSAKSFFVNSSTVGLLENGTVGVSLALSETDSDAYSWTPGTDEKPVADAPSLTVTEPQVAAITASPDSSSAFAEAEFPIAVQLTTTTTGAAIRYSKSAGPTINTGEPYLDDPELRPSIAEGETLYARAFLDGYKPSPLLENTYTSTNGPGGISGLHGRFRSDLVETLPRVAQMGPKRWINKGQGWDGTDGGFDIVNAGLASTTPVYEQDRFGITFDGTDDFLCSRDGLRGGLVYYKSYTTPDLPCTVIIAFTTPSSLSNFGTLFCSQKGSGNSFLKIRQYYSYLQACMTDTGGYEYCSGGYYIGSANTFYVAAAKFTSSSRQLRVNKTDDTAYAYSSTFATQAQGIGLGALMTTPTTGFSDYFPGTVHEVLIYEGSPYDPYIDTVTDYLTAKYNPS
tara:strand:- start:2699 stop:5221 length:2523 start_codon:yes stop_codon:yes gene_type:complete